MKLFYCDHFVLPLPPGHRFPMSKYAQLHARVVALADSRLELCEAAAARDEQILLAHDPDYLRRVESGQLSAAEVRVLGFPWTPALVERSRRSSGATIAACRAALESGVSANLAGGTHHAYADRAQAFCVFNDSAIAARTMQREQGVRQVLVVDCDVHQGNGTAAILAGDPTVFTFSVHGARNFPFRKEQSDLDIELPDGCEDGPYLEALDRGLGLAMARAEPELVIYLAGADPYRDDRLGRLSLSRRGLAMRDRLVFEYCARNAVPVALTMAGGYARDVQAVVDIHLASILEAARFERPGRRRESAVPASLS